MKYFYLIFSSLSFLFSCSESHIKKEENAKNISYEKATKFLESENSDSAFFYLNEAKDIYLKEKDSLRVGKCLIYMGTISTENGDHFGAQEILLEALNYFNKSDTTHYPYLLSSLNSLGEASSNMKDYVKAIHFFAQGLLFSKNSSYLPVLENNLANAYRDVKNYDKALAIYNSAIKNKNNDNLEFARLITNISIARWLKNPHYDASVNLLKALHIRLKYGDYWSQNSSYAHLAEYYLKSNKDLAFYYGKKRYLVAKQINNPDDKLDALKNLITLSSLSETKKYFELYQQLSDSVQTARGAAKNQFALIRYETEKHKSDNLILQKDNTEKKYQLIKQKVLLIGGLTFAFFTIVVSIILYKRRKQRLELASHNAIRENQLRTSKKVHDVVANGLYRVMTEIENNEDLNRYHVLDKLEDMYEKSRNLSYEEINYNDQNFHEKIAALLKSFATETIKVVFVGNTEELWKKVNAQIKYEFEHILQELLVNMKKHSHASNVAVKFESANDRINIFYTDNGIGIPEGSDFKNGLTNTGNRIESIYGAITFDTKAEKGLKIQISFPVS